MKPAMKMIDRSSLSRTATAGVRGLLALSGWVLALTAFGCAHESATGTTHAASRDMPAPTVVINRGIQHVQSTSTGFMLDDKFEFEVDKATLMPGSDKVLEEVATVLRESPDLLEVYIAGFASSEGNAEHNKLLSIERAEAVKSWLVAHGIDAKRLRAGGFGASHPVGDNGTETGRMMNRRAEFIALRYMVNGELIQGSGPAILSTTK